MELNEQVQYDLGKNLKNKINFFQVTNASNADELKALNISNKKTLELLERKISEYFRENDLVNVKYCIIELRYYNSISLLINKIMREKGIVE